uniref:Uncharacterized protein n=1 Tax=Glossina brevipalpis TaxID=37001 RepID=A0A1A9WYB3_9MUSC
MIINDNDDDDDDDDDVVLRVIRAFRSTLEDLNERRSMHSLHSLRSPRNGLASHGYGYPPYFNSNLFNANYSSYSIQHPLQQQQSEQKQGQGEKISQIPTDMIYIDEDPSATQKHSNSVLSGGGGSVNGCHLVSVTDAVYGLRYGTGTGSTGLQKAPPPSLSPRQTETRI